MRGVKRRMLGLIVERREHRRWDVGTLPPLELDKEEGQRFNVTPLTGYHPGPRPWCGSD